MGVRQLRARTAVIGAVVLLSAACASPAGEPGDDTSNAASEASTAPDDRQSATYARYTVDPPGPREGALAGDDLLLVSAETLPAELVDEILALRVNGDKAVTAAETMSVGSFTLENRTYRVAAVDAAAYRRFTPQGTADSQVVWDRVAGGEIAVRGDLENRVPLDKEGYLAVGSGEKTFPIHVGAWSDQVGTVDAVVNTEWGEALGLVEDNALVISTGGISPQAVRKKMGALIDEDVISVSALDVVAQYGLEPGVVQALQVVGTFAEAVGIYRYTPIGGGRVQPEASWVREHIVTEQMPILGSMTCNKYMMPQLREALLEIQGAGLADEIHPNEYAGCFYPRFIAGTTTLSNHSFGLAFDINVPGNQRGTVGEIDRTVVGIFKRWGFAWGGDWDYTDPMHFELERIVRAS